MVELLMDLSRWPPMELLAIAAVVLVLIDYFFPVDFPAYIGYLCFAGAMFFGVPLGTTQSLLAAIGIWMLLLVLHKVWLYRFLTNARDPKSDAPPAR